MATEKRLIGNSFKCDNCIHTKACERLCAIFGWPFFDCEMRSVACKTYEPKVDAVEVVRCKDCKHQTTGLCPMENYNVPWDIMSEDAFCSFGERRTDGR